MFQPLSSVVFIEAKQPLYTVEDNFDCDLQLHSLNVVFFFTVALGSITPVTSAFYRILGLQMVHSMTKLMLQHTSYIFLPTVLC